MTSRIKFTTATSTLALALIGSASSALAAGGAVVALPEAVDMNVSSWTVDRRPTSVFRNTSWEGRSNVIQIGIDPATANPVSFYNWQGYKQSLNTPAGAASLSAGLWLNDTWSAAGTDTDYIRTSIWGSVLPEGSTSYIDSKSVFPIIGFTNQNGVGRLEVWDTTASGTGWNEVPGSSDVLNFGGWNKFEMRVLPGSDTIEYYANGTLVYTWQNPRGEDDNTSDEFWQVYLNPRNNGVTAFDTYWSNIVQSQLITDGGVVTSAPNGLEIVDGATGAVSIADGVTVGGTVSTGTNADATLTFGAASAVTTTANNAPGVVSSQGGKVTVSGGAVSTGGTNAHGLSASGAGSEIVTSGTTIATSGNTAYGAYAANGGTITINGGSVSTNAATNSAYGLRATGAGSTITSTADVETHGAQWAFGAYAERGATINLDGGTITTNGLRGHGLLAERGGTINSAATIVTNGERAHGAQAGISSVSAEEGASYLVFNGGSITTNGNGAYGLLAFNGSTITGFVDIATSGEGSFGVSADGGSTITLTGGSVFTSGAGSHGLQAVYDDRFTGAGVLSAALDVTTTGAGAFGAYAKDNGQITLLGNRIETSGSGAHGIVAETVPSLSGLVSTVNANAVQLTTHAANALGLGISGAGSITFHGGSIDSAGTALGAALADGGQAAFEIADATVTSSTGVLLDVGRSATGAGTGIVTLNLANGARATGAVTDTGGKTTGYTDVTLTGAGTQLTGTINGVRRLSLSNGGIWATTGASTVGEINLANGVGNIAVGPAATVTHAGTISGTGILVKAGAGTLSLTGNGNSFAGATTVIDGTLVLTGSLGRGVTTSGNGVFQIGNGGVNGSFQGNLANSGTTVFAHSGDYNFAGGLTGSGSLVKRGTGRLTLSGRVNYNGATRVEQGSLSLSGGTVDSTGAVFTVASSTGASDILLSGGTAASRTGQLLVVDRLGTGGTSKAVTLRVADAAKVSGTITDIGSKTTGYTDVSLAGTGTQLVGGVNGARRLSLSGGAIWVATGASGLGEINITNGNGVIGVGTNAITHSGTITGNGTLVKAGAGTLTLTGNGSAYAGTTLVNDGTLVLTGALGGNVTTGGTGIFQLGNGGTSGSFQGDLVNNGTFIFARSDNYDFTGDFSGSGSLVKRGAGALTLSGEYSYTGTTTLEQGSVKVAGKLSESSDVDVKDGASLDLSGTEQTVPVLAASGGTINANGATLNTQAVGASEGGTFTAQNATLHTGTVSTSNGGTVDVQGSNVTAENVTAGPGGTINASGANVTTQVLGTSEGGVLNAAGATVTTQALTIGSSSTANLTGSTVSSAQAVELGSGSLVNLTGATLSTLGLTSSSTDIIVGAGPVIVLGETSSVILTAGSDQIIAFNGGLTGSGIVTQQGQGDQKLNGDSPDFTGTVGAASGTMSVNGDFSNATATASNGGTLGGAGTVGTAEIASGGFVGPGNSIGTLHVVGDVTLAAGSTYKVEVNADGRSDQIIAGGVAHIEGASVKVLPEDGVYALGTSYTILEAAGGIDGQFDDNISITNDFAFLTPTLSYDGNLVNLLLAQNGVDFRSVAVTRNQRAVAGALEGAGQGSALYDALMLSGVSAAEARTAFDSLSGELHATTGTFILDQSRRTGELVLNRLQQADAVTRALAGGDTATRTQGGSTAFWGQAIGSWNKVKGDGNASRATQNQYGFITGLDTTLGDWRLGAAFSHTEGRVEVGTLDSRSRVKSSSVAAYAGGGWGDLRAHLGASYGWHDVDGSRRVAFPGLSSTASGNYDGKTLSAFGELSYAVQLGQTLVEPFGGVNHVRLKTDSFGETNVNVLSVGKTKRDVTFTTLGLRLGSDVAVSDKAVITPRVSAAWQHGFGDVEAKATNRLGGQAFTIAGLPVSRNALLIDAGIQASIAPGGALGVSYVGNIADRWQDHGIRLGFSYSF